MIINKCAKKRLSQNDFCVHPLYLIDDYVLKEESFSEQDLFYERKIQALYLNKNTDGEIYFSLKSNQYETLTEILRYLENTNQPNKIFIRVSKNIKPSALILKYFACLIDGQNIHKTPF